LNLFYPVFAQSIQFFPVFWRKWIRVTNLSGYLAQKSDTFYSLPNWPGFMANHLQTFIHNNINSLQPFYHNPCLLALRLHHIIATDKDSPYIRRALDPLPVRATGLRIAGINQPLA